MKKLTILSLASVFAAASFVGCNSDYTTVENTSSSVVVYSFNLSEDDSVLANLDTVFFSIDLEKARIYNADSLPFGTPTNKLVPVIKMLETVTKATLTVTRPDGTDTIYNYLTNSTDTIDFSNGPVLLDITSPSGMVSRTYSIEVNVHNVKSDSLTWGETARRALPSALGAPTAQRTVRTSAGLYCLTTAGASASMAFAATPADDNWDIYTPALPAGADINSFAASDNALFIIAGGTLHTSADGGRTWQSTGQAWHSVYGGYADTLIGTQRTAGGYQLIEYPSGAVSALPEGMPVSGASVPVSFRFPLSSGPQIVIVGGTMADGKLTPHTWAYDGSGWARISNKALPQGYRDMCVVPFFTFVENAVFIATKYDVLMAFGGTDGTDLNRTVYISNDYGMSWTKGGESIQLPEYVPSMTDAQAYVFSSELTASRSKGPWTYFESPVRIPVTRAIAPVTSWDCPYIYTFGGTSTDGTLYNTLWRATINRLTFKPLI